MSQNKVEQKTKGNDLDTIFTILFVFKICAKMTNILICPQKHHGVF